MPKSFVRKHLHYVHQHVALLIGASALLFIACLPPEQEPEPDPCEVGRPVVAESAASENLALHPERCGMPAYQWLHSPKLGAILETRDVIDYEASVLELSALVGGVELTSPPRYDVRLEQVRYQTQDRGQLIDATGVVAYPTNANPGRPFDILLVLHGTSGFTDGCGPSVDDDSRSLVALFASLGMVVVAPDYIGLKAFGEPTGFLHPYLVGEATAIAALDMARAGAHVVRAFDASYCARPRLAFFGGSQGGHAALWVDRLAPYYAQEFTLLGGVATVPPADLMAEAERALNDTVPASGNTAVMLAAGADWYGYGDRLNEIFISELNPSVAEAMQSNCDPSDAVDGMQISDLFTPEVMTAASDSALASYGPWGCLIGANSLLHTDIARITPSPASYGIMYILGENDNLVHTPIERESFVTLCDRGMPLQYLECAGASHTRATAWSYPEIIDFVTARMADEPMVAADRCVVTEPQTCRATP